VETAWVRPTPDLQSLERVSMDARAVKLAVAPVGKLAG
jgi:hypothetical protein